MAIARAFFAAWCAVMLCSGCTAASDPSTMLIPANSTWKYLDDGSNQGTSWRQPAFNDSSWRSGAAPLGDAPEGDRRVINTQLNTGLFGERIITYYFRLAFNVANPGAFANLTLLLRRDDGAIVYLNGTEVARSNMPPGPVDYLTPVAERTPDEGRTWWEFRVSANLLTAGRNVIAVELHEYAYTTDSLFDLQLIGIDNSGRSPTAPSGGP